MAAKSAKRKKKASKTQMVEWFTASRVGDVGAVSSLLEAHRQHLINLANRGLDAQLRQKVPASDVVQVSLIKATFAYSKSKFDSIQAVKAWLQKILSREIRMVYRRYQLTKKRDARRELSIHNYDLRESIDILSAREAMDGSRAFTRQEEFERLLQAIERLPSHYRKIIKWRLTDELSFQAIGDKLNRSTDAARMLFERAMKKLRDDLTLM